MDIRADFLWMKFLRSNSDPNKYLFLVYLMHNRKKMLKKICFRECPMTFYVFRHTLYSSRCRICDFEREKYGSNAYF